MSVHEWMTMPIPVSTPLTLSGRGDTRLPSQIVSESIECTSPSKEQVVFVCWREHRVAAHGVRPSSSDQHADQ